ncbi:hypothetical protein [Serratia marcescens]|uniref:hypothetical protein n=1 Tax=Serratia marcescens TaxID=615 RepID=UPI0011AFD20F|nr:hypothetical protein [Serratia marcescens]
MAEIAKLAIRLQQIRSCAAVTSSGETVLHHTHVDEILSALHDVTAELLANREAQPVGYVSGKALIKMIRGQSRFCCAFPEPTRKYVIGIYLETKIVPPAPAVTEEAKFGEMPFLGSYVRGWNDCRAAMLAQPVSSGYKLPPHVYRELVNCLRDTALKFSGTEQLRERLNTALSQFIEPDHPHTRIVAPEGGEQKLR